MSVALPCTGGLLPRKYHAVAMETRSVPHVLFIPEVRGHLHSNRGRVAETALSCDRVQLHSQYHTSVVCEAHVDVNVVVSFLS